MKHTFNLGYTKYLVEVSTAVGTVKSFWVFGHSGNDQEWTPVQSEDHPLLVGLDHILSFEVIKTSFGLLCEKNPQPSLLNYS